MARPAASGALRATTLPPFDAVTQFMLFVVHGPRGPHLEALVAQRHPDEVSDRDLVIDHQGAGGFAHRDCSPKGGSVAARIGRLPVDKL